MSSRDPDRRAFLRLPASQRRTLLVAALLLPPVTGLLKTAGYKRTRRLLGRLSESTVIPAGDTLEVARAVGRMVSIAGNRTPVPSTCLSRSLLVWALLRRRGIEGEIRLGVQKDKGGVKAHAWVEHHGVPLNDTDDVAVRYAPFGP